ncbi:MAG TPA: thioesterase family protein [Nannocystis sp.]|jgi:acyl-CoA thioesterase
MLRFTDLLGRADSVDGRAKLDLPDEWSQGRCVFGGLVAATAVRAMRAHVDPQRRLRSLHVSFIAPARSGTVELAARTLRSGQNVSHVESRVSQGDELCCVALGMFAADRASPAVLASPPRPPAPEPEGLTRVPYVPGLTPAFIRHFDYRVTEAEQLPDRSELGGWCRFDEPLAPAPNWESIVGLADAWPPTIWPQLQPPPRVVSVSWSLEFVHVPASVDGWWFYRANTANLVDGHAHEHATLWDPAGQVAAVSRRLLAVWS